MGTLLDVTAALLLPLTPVGVVLGDTVDDVANDELSNENESAIDGGVPLSGFVATEDDAVKETLPAALDAEEGVRLLDALAAMDERVAIVDELGANDEEEAPSRIEDNGLLVILKIGLLFPEVPNTFLGGSVYLLL